MKLKPWIKIQGIFYFENAICRILHERSNIASFSVEQLKFSKKKKKVLWKVSIKWQIKISDIEPRQFIFGNRGLHERNKITASFEEHPEFPKQIMESPCNLSKLRQSGI